MSAWVCVRAGCTVSFVLMSSCSGGLPSVLHPFPLFCALAEVSAVLFNPTSLIPITFPLLHSAHCPTAPSCLLHRLHTARLTAPCDTCNTALPDTPAPLPLIRQRHTRFASPVIKEGQLRRGSIRQLSLIIILSCLVCHHKAERNPL